jgi:hypothetical protein
MMNQAPACATVLPHLEAFADGELRGDVLRRVSQHVENCDSCSEVVEGVQSIGETLRNNPVHDSDSTVLAGLADGVVSRIRAEDRESWRGKFERATDDLHWVVVGAGSIAAAFLTVLSVTVVMKSSVEQRADSLAAVLTSKSDAPPQLGGATVVPASLSPDSIVGANGEDDVEFANLAEVNRAGHVMSIQPLGDEKTASDSQALVSQLRGLRFAQPSGRTNLTDPAARQFIWVITATEVRGAEPDLAARRVIWMMTTPDTRVRKTL